MTYEERGIWDELVNQINNGLKQISELITKYINDPLANIGDLKGQLIKVINDTVAQVQKIYEAEVNRIIGDVKTVVECYKCEADKLQINIKDCYGKTQSDITALPEGYLANITKCGVNEYEAGMKLITSATNLADGIIDQFKHIPEKVTNCANEGFWGSAKCIGNVASEVASLVVNIPQKISPQLNKYINDIKEFVKGVPTRIQACAFQQTIVLGQAATAVGIKFYNCVKDKFPNPNICIANQTMI